jgi:hypothetical protein
MFQEKKEVVEDSEVAHLEWKQIVDHEDRSKLEQLEIDTSDSWGKESINQPSPWLDSNGNAKEQDLKESLPLAARSPPPRILSRRLDYRRQRRHQWRSPVDIPSSRPDGSHEKTKGKASELITLNLNTECLDPEPPVLQQRLRLRLDPPPLHDPSLVSESWQKARQPSGTSCEISSAATTTSIASGENHSKNSRLQNQGLSRNSSKCVTVDRPTLAGTIVHTNRGLKHCPENFRQDRLLHFPVLRITVPYRGLVFFKLNRLSNMQDIYYTYESQT